jgi:uncharacterized protein (TIGR00255 family)
MTHSMTAFAGVSGSLGPTTWEWEMRGVNARGLDLRLRLPDGLAALETTMRTALKKALHRGNVTVNLRLFQDDVPGQLMLDEAQLDRVLMALDQIQERAFAKGVTLGQPTAADVLTQRGVIRQGAQPEQDEQALQAALTAQIGPLLAAFTAMRKTEGAALARLLADQFYQMKTLVDQAQELANARKADARRALRAAFARVLAEVTEADDARLAQELALLAIKTDVTEEIDRLRAHIAAAWEILESGGPIGRKLDFLAQEFSREANTLCAKSQNPALTSVGLDMKTVIDQMREQVQNLE